jgi:hypothetical protein
MDVEPYAFAYLVYEELRRRLWPLKTKLNVYPPWTGLAEADQRLWEEAVERALIRGGVIEGDAEPGGYVVRHPRVFKKPKEGEQ